MIIIKKFKNWATWIKPLNFIYYIFITIIGVYIYDWWFIIFAVLLSIHSIENKE